MSYLKKVETKEQPKAEYGWIVNPVINVDKLPRVSKEDININEIFEKLTTEEEPKARGELIHQSFQAIMSSSYLGKKTSDQQSNLQLMKEMAKLSDRNANAIQNGTHFMAILHAKGFSLMFLEETIKLPDGKHKRMDAMFYNQELDTLFVIDWKTGYSCDSSALDTLSLYANRMKELNTKTKIGMFLVYVDYGVVLPGWLAPKTKNKGIKGLEPNFMKFLYYNFSEGYEMDYALFSEENVAEDLILHAIPAEFKLAGKPLCLEDLSDSEIRPFGTLGDYDKKTTRSGKEYKNPQNSNEEHKAQEIVFIEQIPLVNSAEKGSSTKHEVKKEKTEIAIVLTKQTSSPTPSHSPKKKSSPNKSKAKDQNTEEEKSESPLSSPDSSPTKTTRVKKENVENSPYWNLICEEDSLLRSAAKHNIPAEELNTFFLLIMWSPLRKMDKVFGKFIKKKSIRIF